ncbi:MAG: CBS domain-containing protein [Anaerolineae bacterium]|jgi:CBS domain-containing protein
MAHLLIVILDDLKPMPALLDAWRAIGVSGATILQSAGAHRTSNWLSRVGLRALDRLFETEEVRRRTLLTVIEDDDLLERAIAEAEQVVGGFDQPNTGLAIVLPVAQVRGLRKAQEVPSSHEVPPGLRTNWMIQRDTSIAQVIAILDLEPTRVLPETPLDEVAQAMQAHPSVHVACVVNEEGRLVGVLQLRSLADDLFFHIMPEDFLVETFDLEHAMDFARKSRMSTAADAMDDPVWVKESETVRDAFKRMHQHDLPGLPVVNDLYRVTGYINLLELLAVCAQQIDKPANGEVVS